jgi:hypothetical protein
MRPRFKPCLDILPKAQRAMWDALAPSSDLDFVLYGGTAIALRLGHRTSLDFDFFRAEPLDKDQLRDRFSFMRSAKIVQDALNTLVASAGQTQVSFFGNISIGRINAPSLTEDGVLLVASPEDLLATKLSVLDRAEVKDYIDIAALLRAGVPLERPLAGFAQMFNGEPATVLRAIGYFEDGDVNELGSEDRALLIRARDNLGPLPEVSIQRGSLAAG